METFRHSDHALGAEIIPTGSCDRADEPGQTGLDDAASERATLLAQAIEALAAALHEETAAIRMQAPHQDIVRLGMRKQERLHAYEGAMRALGTQPETLQRVPLDSRVLLKERIRELSVASEQNVDALRRSIKVQELVVSMAVAAREREGRSTYSPSDRGGLGRAYRPSRPGAACAIALNATL